MHGQHQSIIIRRLVGRNKGGAIGDVRGLLFSTSHILLGRGRFLHCFTKSLKSRIKKRLISSANNNGRLCNTGNTVMVGYSYCVQNIFSAGQKLVLSI